MDMNKIDELVEKRLAGDFEDPIGFDQYIALEVKSSLYEKSKTGDFVEVCQDMNIVSALPEYTKPKNVGLMFLGMEPDKFFPYTQIDDALQYIKNVIITEKVVKHPTKIEYGSKHS